MLKRHGWSWQAPARRARERDEREEPLHPPAPYAPLMPQPDAQDCCLAVLHVADARCPSPWPCRSSCYTPGSGFQRAPAWRAMEPTRD
ncbi:winged helix-turn-helix domain-containing protein [Streptosporangium sp. NPDC048047]|uniref:winged helix-turn-helix domain-containing protein n=1 Tax=Streptosporangium sp. NPDC048047 TaxID=3155748 RepID=UPI003418A48B